MFISGRRKKKKKRERERERNKERRERECEMDKKQREEKEQIRHGTVEEKINKIPNYSSHVNLHRYCSNFVNLHTFTISNVGISWLK